LDVETLDLLQDILGEYDGTVLLVSHDRDFIDRVATTTVALEGQGRAVVYPGGWSDFAAQRPAIEAAAEAARAKIIQPVAKPAPTDNALSFTERKRMNDLPAMIAKLESEIAKLEELLDQADLFTKEPVKFRKASEMLADRQAQLAAAEEEWLVLADRA
jgi:ABC transport system ATP-binding/permease protein